ncbi:NUDIX hydrolase [Nonomuraea sp. SMC257]|uniref:NUDIX hydrolase n=1 Tax=Nonomuraea montanisoli TaxID=2741721 RepID=A0A7Y6I3I3_9ACTN|nr:NUDIX hydrolase [Nonomuraea montanisoli]NUW29859.1 NUDIX hydrolase [Nonomuraea montanisoli]
MTNHPASNRRPTFVEPEIYYAQLAAVHIATGALITDPAGRVLIVKPNYRPHWLIPGGMVDDGEPPHEACARELKEELGVHVGVERLLVVDWAPAYGARTRPILYLLFDAGDLHDTRIRLQHDELDDYAFVDPEKAEAHLAPGVAARVPAALKARTAGTTIYLPGAGG